MFASSGVRISVSAACAHRALMAASFGSKILSSPNFQSASSTITVGVFPSSSSLASQQAKTWFVRSNSRTRSTPPHVKSARLTGQGGIPSLWYSLVAVSMTSSLAVRSGY